MTKKIVVGLGNPGKTYENTPHNAGQNAVLHAAGKYEVNKWRFDRKSQCWCANLISEDGNILLVIPAGYINKSGESLKKLLSKEGLLEDINGEDLIVVHDDIDLVLGELRVSFGGGSGGHNGLKDIIAKMNTKDFVRVRIGVAPRGRDGVIDKPPKQEVADFLLKPLNFFDRRKIKKRFSDVGEAISLILRKGYEEAMNRIN